MIYKNNNFEKKNLFDAFIVFLSKTIGPLSFLIFTPIFLSTLGADNFAIWILIFSIANFSRIGMAGSYEASIYFISKSKNNNLRKKYASNLIFYILFIIFLLFLLSSILIFFISDIGFIKNNEQYKFVCELSIYGICFILINIYQENLYSILHGLNNFFIPTILIFISKTIILVAQILFLLSGYNLKEVLICSLIIIILLSIFETIFINYFFLNFLNNFTKHLNFTLIKKVYDYSKYLAIGSILNVIQLNIDKLFIAFTVGIKYLTYYSISLSIFLFIQTVYTSFFLWTVPKISGSKRLNLKKFFIDLNILILILGPVSLLIFKFISPYLINLWLGDDFNKLIVRYLNIFLMFNFFYMLAIPINNFFISLAYTRENFIFSFINSIFFIILMVLLGHFFKIEGVIVSRLAIIFAIFYGINKLFLILNKKNLIK